MRTIGLIKGFAITPIVCGRIGTGEIITQGGKKLPKKLDHIVITKNHQANNGTWQPHPEMVSLLEAKKAANLPDPNYLRSIPVRILFDRPENNFRAEYTCFDDKARPVCSGNGETAKRRDGNGMSDVPCPGSDICEFGSKHRCKQLGRLIIGMERTFEHDPLVGFMHRTTSFNSIRALTYRLTTFAAATGGQMAGMPCNLVMKAKSTAASFRTPFYYLDLEPVGGLVAAAKVAADYRKAFEAAGLKRDDLENAVAVGLAQSAFFEGGDDGEEVTEEFFQADAVENETTPGKHDDKHRADPALGSPEQVAEIERLCKDIEKTPEGLLLWLGKAVDTPLASLTADEATSAIAFLMQRKTDINPITDDLPAPNAGSELTGAGSAGGAVKMTKTRTSKVLPAKASPVPTSGTAETAKDLFF